jgi:F-type H+-transporting ATPase subunit delta
MAKVSEREMEVGHLYAKAILVLAEEKGQADELLEELGEVQKALDRSPELEEFLSSPLVDDEIRAKVIDDVFQGKASDLLVDSLKVVNGKGRLGYLRAIVEAYRMAHRELRGVVDTHVRTAVPLTEELRARLKISIAGFTGKRPHLIERIDPSLIGGLVVEVAGQKIDASVASRLRGVSEALSKRASQEIHSGSTYIAEQ